MNITSRKKRINQIFHSLLELPFWLCFLYSSLMPATKTPWVDIENIPIKSKEIVVVVVAIFYLFVPEFSKNNLNKNGKSWHYLLPILTGGILIYATISVGWSGMKEIDTMAMLMTLIMTASAFFLAYSVIAKRSLESVQDFLWRLTIFLAFIGLFYSAQSFLSLGLREENDYQSSTFGAQRVRGPLFAASTGFFILIPALAFAIQELIQTNTKRLFKLGIVFSLIFTIIGLGSRAGLILLGLFFTMLILFMKNKKQAAIMFGVIVAITALAGLLIFSKAKTERLQSLEDTGRSDTYTTSFKIIEHRDDYINIFGSGYGSYWPWYIPDIQGARETNQYFDLVWNPYGALLYHPHSTFLFLIVELGIPGLIYFCILWFVLVRLLIRNLQGAKFPILSCGIFASGFSMFFDFFIFRGTQISAIWWMFMFGALALNFGAFSTQSKLNGEVDKGK